MGKSVFFSGVIYSAAEIQQLSCLRGWPRWRRVAVVQWFDWFAPSLPFRLGLR